MNIAEQMRKLAQANQIGLVNKAIADAVAKGKFECEAKGHLTDETLASIRADGFRIKNASVAYDKFWHATW